MQSEGSGIRDQGPGDGETDSSTPLRCAQNDNTGGQRLVARRIGLEHPLTGERIMLVSQIVL